MTIHKSIVTLAIVFLSSPSYAIEWKDQPFKNLAGDVTNILEELDEGRARIASQRVKDAIDDVSSILLNSLPDPAAAENFKNNQCGGFRDDLQLMFGSLLDISNGLTNLGSNDLGLSLQDPGIFNLVDQVPCRLLFPVYRLNQKVPLVNSDAILQAANAVSVIDGMLESSAAESLLVTDSMMVSGLDSGLDGDGGFAITPACTFIEENEQAINYARYGALSLGVLLAAIGTVVELIGHTYLNGPDEVEVGAWGFAQVSVENDWTKAIGIGLKEVGKVLIQIAGSTTRAFNQCQLLFRLQSLHQDHQSLQSAHIELQEGQKEIVRLLLIPQGRRSTDFCFEESCAFPGK